MKRISSKLSAPLGAAGLLLFCQLPVAAQTNLLQNGDFDLLTAAATLPPWTLQGSAFPVVSNPAAPSDFGVMLHPAMAGELVSFSQEVVLPAPLPGSVRVRFSALVKRGGMEAQLPTVTLHPGGGPPVVLAPTRAAVALDDDFHAVEWTAKLPAAPESFTFRTEVTAGGIPAIQWHFDEAHLLVAPVAMQLTPSSAAPGGVIQISSPGIGPGWQAMIGGQSAPVLFSGPGQLTCAVPPPAPGLNPNLFLPVTLIGPGGATQLDPAGFSYQLPIQAGGTEPFVVSSAGGTQVRVSGQNFTPDLILTDLSNPLRPPFAPELVESGSEFVFTVPATAPPQVNWEIGSPTAPGNVAFFSLQVEDPPTVDTVLPASGPPAGGTLVTVTGTGFQNGAEVFFDGHEAVVTTYISSTELQAVTAPHQMQQMLVSVVNPSGVASPEAGTFSYLEGVRADVNGNDRADPEDVLLALDAVLSSVATEPLNLDADVDGDARLGLPEAIAALNFSEAGSAGAAFIDPPTLLLSASQAVAGETVFGMVANSLAPYQIVILWGDEVAQPITEVQGMSPVAHVFERPGTYQARLLWSQGFTDPVGITILPRPGISAAEMELAGTNELGGPVVGHSGRLDATEPATISIELDAVQVPAAGLAIDGTVQLSGPGMGGRIDLPWHMDVVPVGGGAGAGTAAVTLPLAALPVPGEYFAKLVVLTPIDGTGVLPPRPVTFSLDGYVTEEDCRELEREWQDLRLAKAAKKNDCEELAKRLQDCKDKKAALEAARDAAMAAAADLAQQAADKQAAYDALFASVNQFLSGVGSLMGYPAGGGAPPGGQFVGARKSGASAGVGIQFDNAGALLDRMALYEKVNGHSIGKDLNTLRNCVAQIDALNAQKAAKDAEIADLNGQIAAVDADIAAKEAALAACVAECEALEQALEDMAQAHADKLEQLEEQREAESGMGASERKADDLEGEADKVDGEADAADDVIGGHGGTPGQVEDDEDHVSSGRDCVDLARQKIAEARQKQQEARDALATGDTATAKMKTAEANALLDEASQKLKDASESIRTGSSSAAGRKWRQCVDGTFVMGTPTCRTVWTGITDIAISPMGVKPEEWASTLANARGVLDGIKDFFEFLGLIEEVTDKIGVDIPIGGAVTPDPAETAEAIVNAWLEIFKMTQPYDVWAELTGHTKWFRTDMRCVNGCWTYENVEWEDADVVKRKVVIGTIWGGNKASRAAQLAEILKRPDVPAK